MARINGNWYRGSTIIENTTFVTYLDITESRTSIKENKKYYHIIIYAQQNAGASILNNTNPDGYIKLNGNRTSFMSNISSYVAYDANQPYIPARTLIKLFDGELGVEYGDSGSAQTLNIEVSAGTGIKVYDMIKINGSINMPKISNGHIKVDGSWKNAFAWLKVNGSWKRCIIWRNINGVWKRGK